MGSRHAPLGLQIYHLIISENADHIDYRYGEGGRGGGGSVEKEDARVKWASHYY